MIRKVVNKADLKDFPEIKQNLEYWLGKTPEELVEAVEILRKQAHGDTARLQRVARVVHLTRG